MNIAVGIIGKDITISNIMSFVDENGRLLISSPGGSLYEGWAIHDMIKGKVKEIGVVGVCASAATIILLAAPVRWGTMNSRFLIHNPWSEMSGDATKMQQMANDLLIEEDTLIKRYSEILNIEAERIRTVMKKEVYLLPEEAINLNLITIIKTEIMDFSAIEKQFEAFGKKFEAFSNMLTNKGIIKNAVFGDVDGNELDFGDKVTDKSEIIVGVKATIDGKPAEGKYVFADGTTLVFKGGELIEIIKDDESEESKELKKENKELKEDNEAKAAEIENLKKDFETFKAKAESEIQNISKEFISFRKSFSNEKIQDDKLNQKPITKKTIKL